ncbi:MAG: hypothetical protein QNJ37_09430 [Crocosphaera sp.]|nr:hypothetical protein [Crocosphaera sp.]
MKKNNNLLGKIILITGMTLSLQESVLANTHFFSNKKPFSRQDGNIVETEQVLIDLNFASRDNRKNKFKGITLLQNKENVVEDPNGRIQLRHSITFDWKTKDKNKKATVALVEDIGLVDSIPEFTGFDTNDFVPEIDSLLNIEGFGTLAPFMTGVIPIVDLGNATRAPELIEPLLASNANGVVPIAMFEVPLSVPEHSSTLGFVSLGILGIALTFKNKNTNQKDNEKL